MAKICLKIIEKSLPKFKKSTIWNGLIYNLHEKLDVNINQLLTGIDPESADSVSIDARAGCDSNTTHAAN